VIYYYDESCFHGHDYKKTLWLDRMTDQQKMPGKSKGKLVYCSDFISVEGRIRVLSTEGEYNPDLDAQKIIYPGSNRDPWWDTQQLLL
jgi:hypothetical protein